MALICAACGTENPSDAYFCGKCGAQVWSAFNQPAGPIASGSETAGSAAPTPPAATPNRITPPPPAAASSGGSPFLIDKGPAAPPPSQPIAPPPPSSSSYTPQDYSEYQVPIAATGLQGGYAPSYTPGYAPPPPDGNTSGMGTAYPAPAHTQGWTFAGCVPWGLFGFMNGSTLWGVIGLVSHFLGVSLIYAIYIGIKGKELAWQNRRFDSLQQFDDTMKAWNRWGIILTVIGVVLALLYFVGLMALTMYAATHPDEFESSTTSTPPGASSTQFNL